MSTNKKNINKVHKKNSSKVHKKNSSKVNKKKIINLSLLKDSQNSFLVSPECKKLNKIMHISGDSGSGKSTLGRALKDIYKDKIQVIDVDILLDDYVAETFGYNNVKTIDDNIDKSHIEKYVYNIIKKISIPIVFVGLNLYTFFTEQKRYHSYFNLYSSANFCIDIDTKTLLKQRCNRFLDSVKYNYVDKKISTYDLVNNNVNFLKYFKQNLDRACEYTSMIKTNKLRVSDYKKQKYIFIPPDKILEEVMTILDSWVQ